MSRRHIITTLKRYALAFVLLLLVNNGWAISSSENPSYDGSYTITTSLTWPSGGYVALYEKIGSGAWTQVNSSFTGKTNGTYQYKAEANCWDGYYFWVCNSEGPITVQVQNPGSPSSISTGSQNSDSATHTVSWGTATGASYYQVQQKLSTSSTWTTTVEKGSGQSHQFSVGNGTWQYRARGCAMSDYSRCGGWSGTASIIVAIKPGDPGSTSVSPMVSTNGSHTVSWGPSSGSLTGYQLERSTNGGSTYSNIYTGTALSRAYSSLANGDYLYRVRAYKTVSTYTSYSGWTSSPSNPAAQVIDPPIFSIADVSTTEGGNLNFNIIKTGGASQSYSVDFTTVNDTALAGADYLAQSGTVTFTPTEFSKPVTITTLDDPIYEESEKLQLVLSNPTGGATISDGTGAVVEDGTGVGTIGMDTQAAPSFSITNAQIAESGELEFTVIKTGLSALKHTVNFTTADGDGSAAPAAMSSEGDYVPNLGSVTFCPGVTEQTITVQTLNESGPAIFEDNETLFVNLTGVTSNGNVIDHGTISDGEGIGTIFDDDDLPYFIVHNSELLEDMDTMLVYVQGMTEVGMSIEYETLIDTGDNATPGNAVDCETNPGLGEDFCMKSGTLNFDPDMTNGSSVRTIEIPIISDLVYEGDETFTVRIFNPSFDAPIENDPGNSDGKATATILDDLDAPEFSVTTDEVLEGNPGDTRSLSFSISLNGSTNFSHKVHYTTVDDTAISTPEADKDYTATSGHFTFSDNLPQSFSVPVRSDFDVEGNEQFNVVLSVDENDGANGARVADTDGVGKINNDDHAPLVPASISVASDGTHDDSHVVSWGGATVPQNGQALDRYELEVSVDGDPFDPLHIHNPANPLTYDNLNLVAGAYVYRIKACNVSGCSDWVYSSETLVIPPPVDLSGQPSTLFDIGNEPSNTDPGFTPGEFSVDASGGANYQIPIAVPPGTAGMQPSLSLSYNHRTGNALLGVGWTLGGLSVITRCPTTTVQDGSIDGVDFDGNDKFCIDGERLIAVSGTYGANGTEYRTELDGFTKVVSYDEDPANNNGPEKFKAWTKSGQILSYGWDDTNRNSRIQAEGRTDGAIRLWAVDTVDDTVGNYLTVKYHEDANEYRPDRINYTGNTVANTATYASVRFEYEDRSDNIGGNATDDKTTLYLAGSKVRTTKRLSHIKTYVGSTEVRDYQLRYNENETGIARVSRLSSITECAGGRCFPPTDFTWQGDGSNPAFGDSANILDASHTTWGSFNFITGDWNGDGQTDIFLQHKKQGNSTMYTANADGTMSSTGFSDLNWWAGEDTSNDPQPIFQVLHAGDWNGDGKTDLIKERIAYDTVAGNFKHSLILYQSNGTTFVESQNLGEVSRSTIANALPIVHVGDWNGDGRSDIFLHKEGILSQLSQMYIADTSVANTGDMGTTSYAPNWSSATYTLKVGDFNADGRTDFVRCHKTAGDVYSYLSTGTGMGGATQVAASGWHVYDLIAADYNGDGNTDLFRKRKTGTDNSYLMLSKGDGSFVLDGSGLIGFGNLEAYAGDWNGDGRADLMRQGGDLYIHQDSGFEPPIGVSGFGTNLLSVGDWNGDGLSDLWSREYAFGGSTTQYVTSHSGFDVIEKITDGLGNDTDISYEPLTNSGVYTKGTGASYPEVDLQGAIYVVDSVKTDDGLGIGGQSESQYQYEGAKTHVEGRGFLGFASMTALDVDNDIQSKTSYEQAFPYTGLVNATEQRFDPDNSNILIGEVSSSYSFVNTHTDVVFPYATTVTKKDYDIPTGSSASTLVSTTTTTTIYDDNTAQSSSFDCSVNDCFGNPTEITVDVTDGTDTYTTHTDNTYAPADTSNWILGRLTQAKVTQYLPDYTGSTDGSCTDPTSNGVPGTCDTRVSSFKYDDETDNYDTDSIVSGLLTHEIIEPGDAEYTLTTEYQYDAFGNRTEVKVTGGSGETAIAPRTTKTTWGEWTTFKTLNADNGRFAIKVENALNHEEYRDYDSSNGTVKKLEGPNQLTTHWEYDVFGRQIKETRADGTMTQIERGTCTVGCPSSGKLKVVTSSTSAPQSVVISDSLGREIKRATVGLERIVIETDTDYNNLGQVTQTSRPYFAGTATINIKWHSVVYDDLGRPVTETAPDTSVTSTNYNGLEVSVTNDKGQVNKRKNNVRGELSRVTDAYNKITDYFYDPFGNLTDVIVNAGANPSEQVLTSNEYDIRGRKIKMIDPDMGTWTYKYNALGELKEQRDSICNNVPSCADGTTAPTVSMSYDTLGRLTQRIESEGTSTWVYDTATKGIGKLASVTGAEGETTTYVYDNQGRPSDTTITIEGVPYTTSQTYQRGRVHSITYPATAINHSDPNNPHPHPFGFSVYNNYTVDGHLKTVRNADTEQLYWRAVEQNAEGQLTEFDYGNGITTTRGFDANTGLIDSIIGTAAIVGDIQDTQYDFDTLGNLIERQDLNETQTEIFCYDNLNRLTRSQMGGTCAGTPNSTNKDYDYDAIGNLKFKAGIGHYSYGNNAGPHAVTGVDTNDDSVVDHTFSYDLNGNQTAGYNFTRGRSRTLTWTSYNKPKTIQEDSGSTTLTFSYGANRARFKQVNTANDLTTYYIGGLYEKQVNTSTNVTTNVHYIRAGSDAIAIYKNQENSAGVLINQDELNYLHRDHIGSVTEITGGDLGTANYATVIESMAYDAWGKRRAPEWTDITTEFDMDNLLAGVLTTPRGFTGHEMLDDVLLIHMNGRVYDPDLGRFLSPDPFIQSPANPQNFNRYTYVNNNPLSYTDPSGFFFKKLFKGFGKLFNGLIKGISKLINKITGGNQFLNALIAAGLGYWTGGLAFNATLPAAAGATVGVGIGGVVVQTTIITTAASVTAGIVGGAVGGFVAGAIIGGDLKSAAIGAFTGAAFGGINAGIQNLGVRAAAHGIVGGTTRELQGGDFAKGFISAGVHSALVGFARSQPSLKLKIADFDFKAIGKSIPIELNYGVLGAKALSTSITEQINGEHNFLEGLAIGVARNVASDFVRLGVAGIAIYKEIKFPGKVTYSLSDNTGISSPKTKSSFILVQLGGSNTHPASIFSSVGNDSTTISGRVVTSFDKLEVAAGGILAADGISQHLGLGVVAEGEIFGTSVSNAVTAQTSTSLFSRGAHLDIRVD